MHILCGKCTGRIHAELSHCLVTEAQWDYVLSVLEELGNKQLFLTHQYSTDIFFLILLLLPSKLSNDHPTNIGLWKLIPKMKLDSPELNCSIIFPLYCLIMSKKIDHFLRDLVRRESLFWWLNVNPLSFVHRYDIFGVSTGSLFCGFAFAFDLAAATLTLVCDVWSSCGSARICVLL